MSKEKDKYKNLDLVDPESDDYKQAIEELMEIVTSQPDTHTYTLEDDIENFILEAGIKTGNVTAQGYMIYYEYLLWSGISIENNEYPKYFYEEFFKRFAKRFKRKRYGKGVIYRLCKEIFGKYLKMSKEELAKCKEVALRFQQRSKGSRGLASQRNDEHGKEDFQEAFKEEEKGSKEIYQDSEEEGETE